MNDHCSGCGQKERCSQVYQRLGRSAGPAVGWKATKAFLIPIVIFIAALALSERLLPAEEGAKWLMLVKAGAATTLVLLYVCVLQLVMKKKRTGPKVCNGREAADGDTD